MSPGGRQVAELGPPSFAALLRTLRTGRNMSQEQLAERSGASVRLISNLERGVAGEPRPGTVTALADALGVSGAERQVFLRGGRPEHPPGGRLAFAELLRTLRERAGVTQDDLATRALVSTRTVSDLERGINRAPRQDTAALMADAMGLVGTERIDFEAAVASAAEFVRLRSGRAGRLDRPGRLPGVATALHGRDAELARLAELLRPTAVVTVVGTGGVGKTRLVLEFAHRLHDTGQRVVFVPLSSTRTALDVVQLTAIGLDVALDETILSESAFVEAALDSLAESLRADPATLVLDNVEQVGAAPALIAALAARSDCPIVVTSRCALGISGERVVELDPLPVPIVPDPASPAVTLFLDRARDAAPRWRAEPELADVAALCRVLDGLPLALVLAASGVRTRSVRAIVDDLTARQDLPTLAARSVPHRHRSLHAALGWSHALLDSPARTMLARLSIFRAPVDHETVELICGAGLPARAALDDLRAAHLVISGTDDAGEVQLRMLNTVAQFAAGQLAESGEADALHDRLCAAMIHAAESAAPHLTGAQQGFWQAQLARRVDCLRIADDWLHRTNDGARAARLAVALWRFWYLAGHLREGRTRVGAALDAVSDDSRHDLVATDLRYGLGVLTYMSGDVEGARELWRASREAYAHADQAEGVANSLNNLGMTYLYAGDLVTARSHYEAARQVAERSGSPRQLAVTLGNIAKLQVDEGQGGAAAETAAAALELFRAAGDIRAEADLYGLLAEIAHGAGDRVEAARRWSQALAVFEQLNDPTGIAPTLVWLAELSLEDRQRAGVDERLDRALALAADEPWTTAHASAVLAQLAITDGDMLRAHELLDRAEALSTQCQHVEVQARVTRLRSALSRD